MQYNIPLFRVLLIEDQPTTRKSHRAMLSNMGYKPAIATDAEEALCMIQITSYNLIFIDVNLSANKGLAVTTKIRQTDMSKNALIIGLTTGRLEDITAGLAAGMDTVINKLPSREILRQTIVDQYQKRFKICPSKLQAKIANPVLPVIDEKANQDILTMLMISLPETRAEIEEAWKTTNIKTLLAVIHKLYGGLCYAHTPQLRETARIFQSVLTEGLREFENHYSAVLKAFDEFEIVYTHRV